MVFADTSALFALFDRDDEQHARAAAAFDELEGTELMTSNYVIVETIALMERRLGHAAARGFLVDVMPPIYVIWIDSDLHEEAASVYSAAGRKGPSFVDRVSFAVMSARGIQRAFTFDKDFRKEGFELVP